nr:dihydroorotase [Bacteroidota bacterium]
MDKSYIIRNALVVNEGTENHADVLISNGIIQKIDKQISNAVNAIEINAEALMLMPGAIDDQVHFREPGLTHKGEIYTESRASVAGGITSYMEMPNTNPPALTQKLLQEKYEIGAQKSLANFSFFMGTSNDNLEEVLRTDKKNVCGIKIFMGSSTGSMLVDNKQTLEAVFSKADLLIATHCEDEATIKSNLELYKEKYGDAANVTMHGRIRSEEACYLSSSMAVEMAKKHNTRLHILHISTAKETALFGNDIPLAQKRITSEACIHHLWFCDEDYKTKGNFIKWNPSIKTSADRDAVWAALLDNRIDIIATDHAPHTLEEKTQHYWQAPSGGPLVQHAVQAMLTKSAEGKIPLTRVIEKMCHAPAICFNVHKRGFIREGYSADLVLVDINKPYTVQKNNLLYKCGWSPMEGTTFTATVITTFVNGNIVYDNGNIIEGSNGQRLTFDRE